MLQALPFHCWIEAPPTAQASWGEMSVTAPAPSGIGTTDQAVPLKCSASPAVTPVVVFTVLPTTQMSDAELAEIDWSTPGVKFGSGRATLPHAVPFQCSRSPPVPPCPTAQALLGLRSATPVSPAPCPVTTSEEFTDHAVPFQCSISVPKSRRPSRLNPTAQASDAVLALTPRSAELTPRVGVGTSDHAVPCQW